MVDALPPALAEEIESALGVLEGRDDGHLPLSLRRAVRSHFGDMGDGGAGRRRLFDLYRRCVERVLPVWRAERPQDERPERMMELSKEVLAGRIHESATQGEFDHFLLEIDNMNQELGGRVYAAGRAAAYLLSTPAVGDYGDETPSEADDEDVDPDEWSSDYLASLAEASFFGFSDEDPQARSAFWRWYLEQAVPAAYRSVEGA